jgi:hypothetical protein
MADVWDFGPENATDNNVLLCLANHCDDNGKSCFPSIARIAQMSRRSGRTVVRVIAALEAAGWVAVTRGTGSGVMSQYTVNVAKLKGCHGVTLSQTERVTLTTEKGDIDAIKGDIGDKPPHPLIGRTIKEPSGEPSHAQVPAPPAKETLRPVNPDAGEEMMASVWLFEELGVPSDFGMRDLAAQAIRMQAKEWGGIETAAERILMAAKDAKAGGETRWRFWLTDQGYLRKQNGETRNQGQSRGEANGTHRANVTKQRVDRNRTAVFETAIKRGWISVDDLDGKLGEAVPEPGDEGVDGRIRGGFRAAGPEILPPEIHGSRGGAADQVRSGVLSPA